MITELGLRNFKGFGDPAQTIPMSKITLIYGPNSSGKSSVIQALLLIKQSALYDELFISENTQRIARTLIPNGNFTNLGGYTALLHKHDHNRILGIDFRFSSPSGLRKCGIEMLFETDASYTNQGRMSEVVYSIINEDQEEQVKLSYSNGQSWTVRSNSVSVNPTNPGPYFLPAPRSYSNLEERPHQDEIQNIPTDFRLMPRYFRERLEDIVYLGPLRSHPERLYQISEDISEDDRRLLSGASAPLQLYRTPGLQEKVNRWFDEFEINLKLRVEALGDVSITGEHVALVMLDKSTGTSVTLADVGFGINQVLPVIVEGVTLHRQILCVEQPEIHIHPRLQAHLGDLIIETAKQHEENQWIVETHSEMLMMRLKRRIRDGQLDPSDVSVIYVDANNTNGSTVQQLRLDEDGEFLDHWPHGFFEEGFNELMA